MHSTNAYLHRSARTLSKHRHCSPLWATIGYLLHRHVHVWMDRQYEYVICTVKYTACTWTTMENTVYIRPVFINHLPEYYRMCNIIRIRHLMCIAYYPHSIYTHLRMQKFHHVCSMHRAVHIIMCTEHLYVCKKMCLPLNQHKYVRIVIPQVIISLLHGQYT
jgi:hypothetical protein